MLVKPVAASSRRSIRWGAAQKKAASPPVLLLADFRAAFHLNKRLEEAKPPE